RWPGRGPSSSAWSRARRCCGCRRGGSRWRRCRWPAPARRWGTRGGDGGRGGRGGAWAGGGAGAAGWGPGGGARWAAPGRGSGARVAGWGAVSVVGGPPHGLEWARRLGIGDHHVDITAAPDPAGALAEAVALTGGHGADLVIECTGAPAAVGQGLRLARRGG